MPHLDAGGWHLVGRTTYRPGTPFIYYFGTGWSRYDVPTMDVWEAVLRGYARNMGHPLEVGY